MVVDLESRPSGPRRRFGIALVSVAAAAIVATLLTVGRDATTGVKIQPLGGARPSGGRSPITYAAGGPVEWATPYVGLNGTHLSIVTSSANGSKFFSVNDPAISIHSDPGDAKYQTLELLWNELGVEQRWYIYFRSDGKDWWAYEMRTYDGQSPRSEWVAFTGEYFRTQLGSWWTGNLDVTASDHGVTSHLSMQIYNLQAFRNLNPGTSSTLTTTPAPDSSNQPGNVTVTSVNPTSRATATTR